MISTYVLSKQHYIPLPSDTQQGERGDPRGIPKGITSKKKKKLEIEEKRLKTVFLRLRPVDNMAAKGATACRVAVPPKEHHVGQPYSPWTTLSRNTDNRGS